MLVAHGGHDHDSEVQTQTDNHAGHSETEHVEGATTTAQVNNPTSNSNTTFYVGGGVLLAVAVMAAVVWRKIGKKPEQKPTE